MVVLKLFLGFIPYQGANMIHITRFVAAITLFVALLPPTAIAEECSAVLANGVVNKTIINSDLKISRAANEYIYDTNYTTHEEAKNDGFGIDTVIYGVPLKASGTFTKQQKDTWKKTNIQFKNDRIDITQKRAILNSLVSKEGLDAWSNCIAYQSVGLRAWFTETSPEEVLLKVAWNPVAGDTGKDPIVTSSYIVNGSRASDMSSNAFDRGTKFAHGVSFVAIKRDRKKPVTVVIETQYRGNVSAFRRANIKSPEITEFSAAKNHFSLGETTRLQWRTVDADTVTLDGTPTEKTWQKDISPEVTTTYTLEAINEGGPTSAQVLVTVIQPPPYLKSAVLTFHTTDDNKNKETGVSWSIFRNDGNQVGREPMGHNEDFPDGSYKSFTTNDINPTLGTSGTLQHGRLQIAVDAGKKDDWHFDVTLDLNFSDNSQIKKQWNDIKLGTNPGNGSWAW
jgi:hypothetical protein